MLNCAVEKGANYFFSSTSEVYGDPAISPQPEWYAGNVSTIGKRCQYDQSKRASETLTMLYFKKYNLNTRVARIFNTYGPRMSLNDGRVTTNFIRAILENTQMTIYGDGTQTRSFCYVSDMIDGMLKLLMVQRETNVIEDYIFNLGNTDEITIKKFATIVNDISQEVFSKKRKPDISRAHNILGYNPQVSVREGLKDMLHYYM